MSHCLHFLHFMAKTSTSICFPLEINVTAPWAGAHVFFLSCTTVDTAWVCVYNLQLPSQQVKTRIICIIDYFPRFCHSFLGSSLFKSSKVVWAISRRHIYAATKNLHPSIFTCFSTVPLKYFLFFPLLFLYLYVEPISK